uniref:26S protease regulatory subunit 6A homolog B n=1 Tax=Culex pipiens TaxID=7175 RepID=A0A8D8H8J8_CULPI
MAWEKSPQSSSPANWPLSTQIISTRERLAIAKCSESFLNWSINGVFSSIANINTIAQKVLDPALLRISRLDLNIKFPHPDEDARGRSIDDFNWLILVCRGLV